jgi:hydroxymethylpyrimidine pyrophosphatase-like HAD family hydrolase
VNNATNRPTALFCFDFDGTLIDHEEAPELCESFLSLLPRLRAAGAVWSVSTGRTLEEVLEGLSRYPWPVLPDYLMTRERELHRPGAYNHHWHDVGDWNERSSTAHAGFALEFRDFFRTVRRHIERHTTARLRDNGPEEPPDLIASSDEEMDAICRFIETSAPGFGPIGYQRNSVYLRFSHAEYHKGSVLQELTRVLGLTPTRVFAAGDNHNDLSMLAPGVARFFACPANSIPTVKAAVQAAGGYVAQARASRGLREAIAYFSSELGVASAIPLEDSNPASSARSTVRSAC